METDLHITIKNAGDPEKLGQLLKAALDTQEQTIRVIVPTGYRCHECFAADGGHDAGCSMIVASKVQDLQGQVGE